MIRLPLPKTIHKRSQWVLHGKRALLSLAALLGLSIVVVAMFNSGESGGRVVLSGNEKTDAAPPMMLNPRYHGVDNKNRPFTVTAKSALQNKDGSVAIEEVSGDMLMDEESWLAVNAKQGLIDKNGRDIELMGSVNMFYEGGYEFRSEYAKVLTDEGRAFGNQPIEGQCPSGTLQADSFEVTQNGQQLNFRQHVRVILYLD